MTIDEATQILRDRGYHIAPMPESMPRPGYLWTSDPRIENFDAQSEDDVIMLAEALHGNHRCHYCHEAAESRCPTCQKWVCWDDRRDFPPNFNEHWCIDCTGKHNAIMASAMTWNYI